MKETLKLEDVLPLLSETLERGGSFTFMPHGTSMLPLLREGIDSVRLVSPQTRPPKKGDVILYRRKNGAFVLHRIQRERKNTFVLCGDNQTALERGVARDSVIGVADAFYRGGDLVSCDEKSYKRYVKRRIFSRSLRHALAFLKRRLAQIKKVFGIKKA